MNSVCMIREIRQIRGEPPVWSAETVAMSETSPEFGSSFVSRIYPDESSRLPTATRGSRAGGFVLSFFFAPQNGNFKQRQMKWRYI